MEFSDYIVYVDESGDHGLVSINALYPVFVLAFCVFEKQGYASKVVPAMTSLKFDTFGHDMVVLHERDIRKKDGAFRLLNKEQREGFMGRLTNIIAHTEFRLVAVVIDKVKLLERYPDPHNPYHEAMKLGLERVFLYLNSRGQGEVRSHVVFEARGKREDAELELEFRRVRDGANSCRRALPLEIVFADKRANSAGLQFADMVARPIGMSILRPDQPNRAMDVLKTKFDRSQSGEVAEYGLKVFP
jgi:hypothetical protein